jgi:hypothetical protein
MGKLTGYGKNRTQPAFVYPGVLGRLSVSFGPYLADCGQPYFNWDDPRLLCSLYDISHATRMHVYSDCDGRNSWDRISVSVALAERSSLRKKLSPPQAHRC